MSKMVFPQIGDIAYLIHRAVIVKEILADFQIVKVSVGNGEQDFYTDIMALTKEPNLSISSMNINLFLGGAAYEQNSKVD